MILCEITEGFLMARLPSSFHKLSVRARDALCELTVTTEQDFALVEHVLASGNAWHRFERPKPRGGVRVIYAPETPLMDYLKRVLRNVLQGLEMHRCVHGGHPGRSVITNARRHADGAKARTRAGVPAAYTRRRLLGHLLPRHRYQPVAEAWASPTSQRHGVCRLWVYL